MRAAWLIGVAACALASAAGAQTIGNQLTPGADISTNTVPGPGGVPQTTAQLAGVANGAVQGPTILVTGLVDDGTTDNAPQLQAALNAAFPASGSPHPGCLYVPAANNGYVLKSPVTLPSHACLTGSGAGSLFVQPAGSSTGNFLASAAGATDVHLSYLGLQGSSSATATTEGLLLTSPSSSADHLYVTGFLGDGIAVSSTGAGVTVTDSIVSSPGKAGITVYAGTQINLTGDIVYNPGSHGIGIIGAASQVLIDHDQVYLPPGTIGAADCFTGYNALNYDITISNSIGVNCGNHGAHFGGSKVSYVNLHIENPQLEGVFHGSKKIYTPGTISVTNGSQTVTGLGTSWLGLCPAYLPTTQITIAGQALTFNNVSSNTNLTLSSPYTGATASGLSYAISCYVGSTDVVMKGNVVRGVSGAGKADFWIDQVTGFDLDNESEDSSSGVGFYAYGSSNGTIRGSYSNKAQGGYIYSENHYTAGTAGVTSGSTAVTGTGTTWLSSISNGQVFHVAGDAVNYTVSSVNSNTSLTLAMAYAGATNASAAYSLDQGVSSNINIDVTASNNTVSGVQTAGCISCRISGVLNSNGQYGYYEAPPSLGTVLGMFSASGNGTNAVLVQPGTSGGYIDGSGNTNFVAGGVTRLVVGPSLIAPGETANWTAPSGPSVGNFNAAATQPTFLPNKNDVHAGIGADAAGDVSMIADNAGAGVEILRATPAGALAQRPLIDATGVRVVLAGSYMVPANTSLVRFVPSAATTSTIALPSVSQDGFSLQLVNESAFAITTTFSPAVTGWTNGSAFAATSGVRIRWDATAAGWFREQ
jgi:hypothetical protein